MNIINIIILSYITASMIEQRITINQPSTPFGKICKQSASAPSFLNYQKRQAISMSERDKQVYYSHYKY